MAPSRALKASLGVCARSTVLPVVTRRSFTASYILNNESHLPRVADPSLWRSLVPKVLRREKKIENEVGDELAMQKPKRKREWNPATIFIILALMVGSNAINIIALRREMVNFNRKTDAKLALLREVLQKVKNGEEVDVERILGKGDAQQEQEWETVMREIEETDVLLESKRRKDAKRVEKAEQKRSREGGLETNAQRGRQTDVEKETENSEVRRPKFLM